MTLKGFFNLLKEMLVEQSRDCLTSLSAPASALVTVWLVASQIQVRLKPKACLVFDDRVERLNVVITSPINCCLITATTE